MRRLLFITLLVLPGAFLAAQQPVQVTPQLLPPYSLQVSEYYSPGAAGNKLNLLLLLRDFTKPTLQVRLRMSIEAQGVALRTKDNAVFTPMTLEAGIPKYIDPSELAPYFNSNNLQFSGITQQQYEQTGKLPEGFYTFCFEVIEAGTGQVVSDKGCSFAWMTLNEPPFLNMPRKGEEIIPVTFTAPPNILFQWTPRHMASPTAAFTTEYFFELYEFEDDDQSPEMAIAMNPLLDSITVYTTTYLYTDPEVLIPGKRYVWRVQARAKNGLQDLALFRNNGYSEIFWFTYETNCTAPQSITATPQGQRVNISWNPNVDHLEYKVEYRRKYISDAVWFEISNTSPTVSINDLKADTLYEYRVGGACDYGKFIFSPVFEFHTLGENATIIADCGQDPNLVATTEPLLQTLNPGDIIKAGDFDVTVTQVNGQGNFSGEGYVKVSWMADVKLGVRFHNIQVATDNKLKLGEIVTTYDPNESSMLDIDEFVEEVKAIINDLQELVNWFKDAALGDKQLKENLEKFRNELEKLYDEELRNEGTALYNQLDQLNEQYIALQNQYLQATTQQEKDEILQQMDQLKAQKEQLTQQLEEFNEKVASGPKELTQQESEIILIALKKIQDKYTRHYIDSLKQEVAVVENEFDDHIIEQRKNYSTTPPPVSERETIYLGSTSDSEAYGPTSKATLFIQQEMALNRAQILRAFARTSSSPEELAQLASILKIGTIYYRSYVAAELQNNTPIPQIATAVEEAIETLATFIIQEKIYK